MKLYHFINYRVSTNISEHSKYFSLIIDLPFLVFFIIYYVLFPLQLKCPIHSLLRVLLNNRLNHIFVFNQLYLMQHLYCH